MGIRTFNQFNIGRTPAGQNPPSGFRRLNFRLISEPIDGVIAFYFEGKEESDSVGVYTERLNFDMSRSYEVQIELDSLTKWYWSNELSAMTTKKHYRQFYLDLMYSENGNDDEWVFYDDTDHSKRYRFIKFFALFNEDADLTKGARHAFSLNINLQTTADPNSKALPITLDPDIRNPPPDGEGYSAGQKMFLSAAPMED